MKGNPDGILYCCMPKRNPIQEERLSRQLFQIDAIGIWLLAGKNIEEWLKIKRF